MPRQSKWRSAHRDVPQQIDLFAENAPTIGGMPVWSGLPTETQAALTTPDDEADPGPRRQAPDRFDEGRS